MVIVDCVCDLLHYFTTISHKDWYMGIGHDQ